DEEGVRKREPRTKAAADLDCEAGGRCHGNTGHGDDRTGSPAALVEHAVVLFQRASGAGHPGSRLGYLGCRRRYPAGGKRGIRQRNDIIEIRLLTRMGPSCTLRLMGRTAPCCLPTTPIAEAARELDRTLQMLTQRDAVCRRVLGRLALALLRWRAHHELGFARLGDYTRERLGLSAREVQSLARVEDRLRRLPRIAAAFEPGGRCR